ncbi:MAG: M20 family metallo-hydrolase [Desulfatiglandales bacterium]
MSKLKDVLQWIEGSREEIIALQRELTARPALGPKNGGQGEHDKASYLKDLLAVMAPDDMEEIRAPDEEAREGYRPNLMARWRGDAGEPTVWVLSHMDIVPPGDLSLWDGDPYEIRVEGDKITGRGVQDDQHGIVSSYLALKAVRESGQAPRRSVGLGFVADEETGSRYGLEYVLSSRRDLFDARDLIIVPDAGNAEGTMIEVAEKSMVWFRFTVAGTQCHASTPDKGNNTLFGMAKLILALSELKNAFNLTDDLFSPPVSTFESTKVEANVPNVNTIPGRNVFYMDCRVLPLYRVEDIVAAVSRIAKEVGDSTGLSIEVETVQRQEAPEPTPLDSRVVTDLSRAIKAVSGLVAVPRGIGGGTVAALLREAGLRAAVWLSDTDSAHQPNEYCLISDIIKDGKILSCLFLDQYGPM